MKLLSALIIVLISAATVMITNEEFGESIIVSSPYEANYTYCAVYNPKMVCTMWVFKTETRVNTEVKGLFYDTTSYQVVSK